MPTVEPYDDYPELFDQDAPPYGHPDDEAEWDDDDRESIAESESELRNVAREVADRGLVDRVIVGNEQWTEAEGWTPYYRASSHDADPSAGHVAELQEIARGNLRAEEMGLGEYHRGWMDYDGPIDELDGARGILVAAIVGLIVVAIVVGLLLV